MFRLSAFLARQSRNKPLWNALRYAPGTLRDTRGQYNINSVRPGCNGRNLPTHQAVSDTALNLFEGNTHPFIVKIWLEETAEETGRATWRGHITRVPSGERRDLDVLDDIIAFIAPYLEGMGVELGLL